MVGQELTIQQIADIKQVSHWTVRRWLASGILGCVRHGKNVVRVTREEFEKFNRGGKT